MINAQNAKYVTITPPAAVVDDASFTTTEIDTKGWDYMEVVVVLGATDIAMAALSVTESDTSSSGHANITGLIFGTSTNIAGDTSALPTADNDDENFAFQFPLTGRKRYIDVTATAGNGSTGTYATIFARLSRGETRPTTAAQAGFNQILRIPT